MKLSSKKTVIFSSLLVFILLPVLLFNLGEAPDRTVLKDSISILTIIAFSLMLQQFFLNRHTRRVSETFKLREISIVHKVIGYGIAAIFLLHPLLLILPRFSEPGVEPMDALITILTTFESLGVVLGLVAWCLMLLLGLTALFRYSLVKKLGVKYRTWRIFHGIFSIVFISLASWHAIDLGRHINLLMAIIITFVVLIGSVRFASQYFSNTIIPTGAK